MPVLLGEGNSSAQIDPKWLLKHQPLYYYHRCKDKGVLEVSLHVHLHLTSWKLLTGALAVVSAGK